MPILRRSWRGIGMKSCPPMKKTAVKIENFVKIYEKSFIENWELPALTDYVTQKTMTYADMATAIAKIHLYFESIGLSKGDKVALCGKDSVNWVLIYMATVTYGAVIVPILSEFNPSMLPI